MAEPMRFIFNLHCHQPLGNFGFVFQRATDECYRPLLEALARHPGVRFVFHASGFLWEWWDGHAPDVVALVASAVAEGRCEVQCAGLYEPILPAIPRPDRADQIALHQAEMARRFGVSPRSLWLTERVWEPGLASELARAGVHSVPVDDHHFEAAGKDRADLDGLWVTEDEGESLILFPISARLRYLIPFQPVAAVMGWLRERHDAGQELLVFGDDGEKFGVWPDTREWVFDTGWLEAFLTALEEAHDWLRTTTFEEALEHMVPSGRVYLPSTSYEEMDRWCLPTAAQWRLEDAEKALGAEWESIRPFVRGTLWRNMLVKYPEANRLYRRMQAVSASARRHASREKGAGETSALAPGVHALLRAQCNCAYWHGVFGGLYLPFLREAVVSELIAARRDLEPGEADRAEIVDLDGDGRSEVLLERAGWSLWIAPDRGGVVEVWEDRRAGVDLAHVVGRHAEAYHRAAAAGEEEDAEAPRSIHHAGRMQAALDPELLIPDACPRASFAWHWLEVDEDPAAVVRLQQAVGAATLGAFLVESVERGNCRLSRTLEGGARRASREYTVTQDGVLFVDLALTSQEACRGTLVVRSDLAVPRTGAPTRGFLDAQDRFLASDQGGEVQGTVLRTRDDVASYRWSSSLPFRGLVQPLWTASRTEAGLEPCQQGTTLALIYALDLAAGESWSLRLGVQREETPP